MITGSIVALVTPMHPDGGIDWQGLERLLDLHVEAGTAAIGAVGTTGESATLSVPEHCEFIRYCVDSLRGRLPVIAGTGSNSTVEAIELTTAAAEAGAAYCLLVTPYYNRPTQRGLYEHFRCVAQAVDIPQILYNVPGRTAVDLHNDTVIQLSGVANIVGIKDATGDLSRVPVLRQACGENFAGGQGAISVAANVAPALTAELCRLALAGDRNGAAEIDQRLAPLYTALYLEANPIPVKWALQQQGLIGGGIRLPMTELDERFHAEVNAALRAVGV
mgnify:CR=1 FL=1